MKAIITINGKVYNYFSKFEKGEVGQIIEFTVLDDNGAVVDLTTYTTQLKFKFNDDTDRFLFYGTCTNSAPTYGQCYYTIASNNLSLAGVYEAFLELTKSGVDEIVNLGYASIEESTNVTSPVIITPTQTTDDLPEGSTNKYMTNDLHNQKLINVATPTLSTDAATKGYVDSTETTISGNLTAHTSNTSNPHSTTASQVGNATAQWNADKIQGISVHTGAPSDTQALLYSQSNSRYQPSTVILSANNSNTAGVGVFDSTAGSALQIKGIESSSGDLTVTNNVGHHTVDLAVSGSVAKGPASATDNAVARFDGPTGKLIQNSSVFVDDTGKVGIGTAAPVHGLQVKSGQIAATSTASNYDVVITSKEYFDANSTAAENPFIIGDGTNRSLNIVCRNDSADETGIKLYSDNTIAANRYITFNTNKTEKMRLDANGFLGIGTNTPLGQLHISNTSDPQIRLTNPTANPANSGKIIFGEGTDSANSMYIKYDGSTNMLKFTTTGEAFYTQIDRDTGKLGINITPTSALHIKQFDATSNGGIAIQANDTTDTAKIYRANTTTGNLILNNNSVDAVFVGNGKVGIGAASTSYPLEVTGQFAVKGANPIMYLIDTDNSLSNTTMRSFLGGASETVLDIDPITIDNAKTSAVRMFRNVNTTAAASLSLLKGDGTSTESYSLRTNGASYFDKLGNKIRVGSATTPTYELDVTGDVNISTGSSYRINGTPLAKGDVGLSNVDNTSDVNKPVSTAQATAIGLKLAIASNLSDVNNRQTAVNNLTNVSAATNEYVLTKDTGTGNAIFKVVPTAPVTSVFGRTTAVVAATNDYTWAQINKATSDIADITTKSHTSLTSIGTNTHAQIDTAITNSTSHISNTSNPHSTTGDQVLPSQGSNNGKFLTTNGSTCSWGTPSVSSLVGDIQYRQTFTAGENVSAGDVCYFKSSDQKMWKVDADAEATSAGLLSIATGTITANNTGTYHLFGDYTTSGLTAGSTYWISATTGAITTTRPSTAGQVSRIVGYALSTTVLKFVPDNMYITN